MTLLPCVTHCPPRRFHRSSGGGGGGGGRLTVAVLEAVAVASGVTLRFGSSSAGPPNVMLELPCGGPLVSWRGATEAVAMGSVS